MMDVLDHAGTSSYLIFFCSVRSPSLTSMADSRRKVEFADLDWLFFIPSNHRTSSLMACTLDTQQNVRHQPDFVRKMQE